MLFLSNLTREIVKDLEDIEGDKLHDSKTLPVVFGIKTSKVVATIVLITLLSSLLLWPMIDLHTSYFRFNRIYLRLILTLPLFYFLNELYKAQHKNHYHQLSQELNFT